MSMPLSSREYVFNTMGGGNFLIALLIWIVLGKHALIIKVTHGEI